MRTFRSLFSIALLFFIFLSSGIAKDIEHNIHDMEENEEIFAFVKSPSSSSSAGMLKSNNEKFKVAKKVFDALIEARGDRRMQAPTFVMSRKEKYVAWMNPNRVEIGLEEKAYDICTSFGEDSLDVMAIMLGHEIAHYYEKHSWKKHFAKSHGQNLESLDKLESLDEGVRNETEADFAGGFLAYSAGYNTFGHMPKFLDKVYTEYGLPDNLKGYPSKADRKKISEESEATLKEMIEVYEMANAMTAIGEYDFAIEYYKYVLGSYQSREIYNNIGVLMTLAAMDKYFTDAELDYYFPVQLDLNFRVSGKGTLQERVEKRNAMLKEAIRNFNAALSLDESYATAQLNKACAYALMDDYPRAEFYNGVEALQLTESLKAEIEGGTLNDKQISDAFKKEMNIRIEKTLADIEVLRGIIAARKMKKAAADADLAKKLKKAASDHFDKAIQMGSDLAQINKNVLEGKEEGFSTSGGVVSRAESVTGAISIEDVITELEEGTLSFAQEITISKVSTLGIKDYPQTKSRVLAQVFDDWTKTVYLHKTEPGFEKATRKNIKIGDTRKQLVDAYGNAKRYIQLVNGDIMVYEQQTSGENKKFMLFIMEQNKVKSWSMALIEEMEDF